MRSVLLICSLFFVATVVRGDLNEDEKKIFEVLKEDFIPCAQEAGLQPALEPIAKADMSPEDASKMFCAYACVMKRRNILEGAEINVDKMKELFAETIPEKASEYTQMIDTCVGEVKGMDDECAVLEKFSNCMEKM
ncbi:pheromone-binding protein Gp-9-like [Augochlora pura]